MRRRITPLAALTLLGALAFTPPAAAEQPHWFGIQVVDGDTGRGVPMVELRTTNSIVLHTDSAGWAAFHEPGLMDTAVFFHVEADGYEHAEDGFGYRGVRLHAAPGETAEVTVRRTQAAERLYRLTGAGVYRDSVLLGREVPLAEPLLNGRVMGQDSANAVVHNGKLYWFWGDTGRPEYPLGNYDASGAVADLPEDGGLPPAEGVDYRYFVREDGFSRGVVDIEGEGAKWLSGLFVVEDNNGHTRMVAQCARMRSLGELLERLLVVWDEEREVFVRLEGLDGELPLYPRGHAFAHTEEGRGYIYFASPYPDIRVPADWDSIQDQGDYEGFTLLEPGGRFDPQNPAIERDEDGEPVWGWKRNTPPVSTREQRQLVADGHIEDGHRWHLTLDADGGGEVHLWNGSVRWNSHLERWIMIANEIGGDPSFLGEVWLAAADSPAGPWPLAVKVATHRTHSFYNPVHHDFFDEEDGRIIYFEGTISRMFSHEAPGIPRYDYNQLMYRVDLADERLEGLR